MVGAQFAGTWRRWTWLVSVAAFVSLVFSVVQASAQPAAQGGDRGQVVRGTVQRFTTAKKGEVDGVVLDDGTLVHWPPHQEGRFKNVVKQGDRIRVMGRTEVGKKGDKRFEVETLANLTTQQAVDLVDGPDARATGGQTVRGTVQRSTIAKKGAVDGLILEDGTWVHWPPHLESRFAGVASKGDRIRVTGRWETGKKGESKFEVESLTNLTSSRSVDLSGQISQPTATPTTDRQRRIRQLEQELEQIRADLERARSSK
jgi:hypothetical protein